MPNISGALSRNLMNEPGFPPSRTVVRDKKEVDREMVCRARRNGCHRFFGLTFLHSADKAQLSSYALFLTSSFPRRRESRNVAFGATRRRSFFDWQPFGWRKRTGFRLSPE
jgi:hypothetical protein